MEALPNSQSLAFVESLYADYAHDPASVPEAWRHYFESLANGEARRPVKVGPSFRPASLFNPPADGQAVPRARELEAAARQERVDQLIRAYRVRGHMAAKINPLDIERPHQPELDLGFYGFTEADLDRPFSTDSIKGPDIRTLRDIYQCLRNTYCRSIGVQFMHIDDVFVRQWLQERMEGCENRLVLSRREQFRILSKLTDAVLFEEFIQKKYVGAKSFSLEGGESLIPLLDMAIDRAAEKGVTEVVLGMAHRGRLNVLANIVGKSTQEIFREFGDVDPEYQRGRGDVKYHLGFSSDLKTSSGRKVHMSLCFNPSHLEFVNPVALGRMRAKQDRAGDKERKQGLVLLIHGDAAFIGEGITQEVLNLSELKGYTTGGTVHIIVNNQIGFTTSPAEGSSSVYNSDVAKMLQSPVFHVNGEDPEAVAQVVQLALDFLATFKRDIFIDMLCYRRRGHNETDEPAFTQPLLYRAIGQRKSVREGYLEHLLQLGGITREEADQLAAQRGEILEEEFTFAHGQGYLRRKDAFTGIWQGYIGGKEDDVPEVPTGADRALLARLLEAQTHLPEDFHPHPKIERMLKTRREMAAGKTPLDWAAAEILAYATLAVAGTRIRLTGQDAARGTFSHRHGVLYDYEDGHPYMPLRHLAPDQGSVEIYNSPLSEIAVLGYEYGYSLDCPDGLVLWEAQFGDFCNVAQVIIDQFIVSAEDKWRRTCGLVLLLPHGFEGSGPEHSSARLERFLNLCAEDNIQVVNLTTPAQIFHCLRRQVLRPWRKPLVVMSPKSLLRHPAAVSSLDELAASKFNRILPDAPDFRGKHVKRVLWCSGKIYYELEHARREKKRTDVAIVRLEELYPLDHNLLRETFAPYKDGTPIYWVQEEPANMGAWWFLRMRFGERFLGRLPLSVISRPASASPATGSSSSHKLEQKELLDAAFAGL